MNVLLNSTIHHDMGYATAVGRNLLVIVGCSAIGLFIGLVILCICYNYHNIAMHALIIGME